MWTRSLSAPQVQAGQRRPIATGWGRGGRVPTRAPTDALSVRWALGAFVNQRRDRTRTGLGSKKPMTSCELLSPPTWASLFLLLSSPKGSRNGCLPVGKNESTSSTVLGALGSSERVAGGWHGSEGTCYVLSPKDSPYAHTHKHTPPTSTATYTHTSNTHTHSPQASGARSRPGFSTMLKLCDLRQARDLCLLRLTYLALEILPGAASQGRGEDLLG